MTTPAAQGDRQRDLDEELTDILGSSCGGSWCGWRVVAQLGRVLGRTVARFRDSVRRRLFFISRDCIFYRLALITCSATTQRNDGIPVRGPQSVELCRLHLRI